MIKGEQDTLIQRRAFLLGGIKSLLGITLVGRLYHLQILNHDHYKALADRNRFSWIPLLPPRGRFLDQKGRLLAGNRTSYNVFLNVYGVHHSDEVLKYLDQLIGIDIEKIRDVLHMRSRQKLKRNTALLVKEGASWDVFSKIELNKNDLPGVSCERIEARFYPEPFMCSHVLGYVGNPSPQDKHSLGIPDLKVGKNALEKTYDLSLQGKIGWKQIEVDAKRRPLRNIQNTESTSGIDHRLTLNLDLQRSIYDLFKTVQIPYPPLEKDGLRSFEKKDIIPCVRGSCIVMDARTGAIIAYVSYPGYDSNQFLGPIKPSDWKKILQDPSNPLLDKGIQGLYAPGSVFKMIVALAALEAGVIHEKTSFTCPGCLTVGNRQFYCHAWKSQGHGTVSLKTAIARSCDVYFYQVAQILGMAPIIDMAHLFGFGHPSGIDIPGEKKGLVPTKEWKRKTKKQAWTMGDTINLSIGQGFLLATPIQLARMMAMLVNGGAPITPHFYPHSSLDHLPIHIALKHREIILESLSMVVNHPLGTAYKARIKDPHFQMAGKTGSSQVSRITQKQREQNRVNDKASHLQDHAIFVAHAPFTFEGHASHLIVSVVLENGGSGGKVAAPFARSVLLNARSYL